jgi:hypothetical protein
MLPKLVLLFVPADLNYMKINDELKECIAKDPSLTSYLICFMLIYLEIFI